MKSTWIVAFVLAALPLCGQPAQKQPASANTRTRVFQLRLQPPAAVVASAGQPAFPDAEAGLQLAQAELRGQAVGAVNAVEVHPGRPAIHARRGELLLSQLSGSAAGQTDTILIPRKVLSDDTQTQLLEDMNVMATILKKAAQPVADQSEIKQAMGIVVGWIGSGGPSPNLFIEGYGAVFLLNVKFPLVPAAAENTETKGPTEEDSTWEQTKRELYGPRSDQNGLLDLFGGPGGSSTVYDGQKVSRLKRALVDSLKNASHMRHLTPADSVTVVVSGPAPASQNTTQPATPPPASRLILRAAKADIDAFAGGRMNEEAFAAKVNVLSN